MIISWTDSDTKWAIPIGWDVYILNNFASRNVYFYTPCPCMSYYTWICHYPTQQQSMLVLGIYQENKPIISCQNSKVYTTREPYFKDLFKISPKPYCRNANIKNIEARHWKSSYSNSSYQHRKYLTSKTHRT